MLYGGTPWLLRFGMTWMPNLLALQRLEAHSFSFFSFFILSTNCAISSITLVAALWYVGVSSFSCCDVDSLGFLGGGAG